MSFWLEEALAHDPGAPAPPLTASLSADVCIVGGGFAGTWTALRLRTLAPDLRIALIERDIVGAGASGRNGGVLMSSWFDLEALTGLFGESEGVRYATVQADSIGAIGDFAADAGIDAWYHRDGFMFVQSGSWQEPLGIEPDETLRRHHLDDRVRGLTGVEARAIVNSPTFLSGTFTDDVAVVQPARLARGLRRVLLERGVHIFEHTAMTGLERTKPAVVRTSGGAIKADHVVITTGAWAAGMPSFRRSIAVISEWAVATEPIPSRLRELGWSTHVGVADRRGWVLYLRPTDDGRIVVGGGAGGAVYGGRASGRAADRVRRFAEAPARGMLQMFPQLEGVRFTHAWGGPIDMTPPFLPFYRTLAPGNIHAGIGYSGHGMVQTYVGGHILAATALGIEDEWTSLGINRPELMKVPPEPIRYPLVGAAANALVRGDARQDAGRPRGAAYSWIGEVPDLLRARLVRKASR